MYRQCHRFLYHLKLGSMQCYGAVYTHNIKKIKGTAYFQTDTLTVRVNQPLHVMTHLDCRRWTRVRTQTRTVGFLSCTVTVI